MSPELLAPARILFDFGQEVRSLFASMSDETMDFDEFFADMAGWQVGFLVGGFPTLSMLLCSWFFFYAEVDPKVRGVYVPCVPSVPCPGPTIIRYLFLDPPFHLS